MPEPKFKIKEGTAPGSVVWGGWYDLIEGGYIDPRKHLEVGAERVERAIETLLAYYRFLDEAGVLEET
jgi:hypothetical protein